MTQQPDKLFHDKLANLNRPAPAGAWSRLEATVNKKKDKKIFLRIAASVILLIAASYLIWTFTKASEQATDLISEKSTLEQPGKPDQEKSYPPVLEKEEPTVIQAEISEEMQEAKKVKPPENTSNKTKQVTEPQPEKTYDFIEEPAPIVVENLIADVEVKTEQVPTTEKQIAHESNYKLVIQSDYVNENYLDKNSVAQATEEDDKSSRLMKLLNKAYDLKSNQNALGELRQKKNEILALNLQKDKKNNKTRN